MFDAVALGEVLIDFTPYGTSANGNPLFERNPGCAGKYAWHCPGLARKQRLSAKSEMISSGGSPSTTLNARSNEGFSMLTY